MNNQLTAPIEYAGSAKQKGKRPQACTAIVETNDDQMPQSCTKYRRIKVAAPISSNEGNTGILQIHYFGLRKSTRATDIC